MRVTAFACFVIYQLSDLAHQRKVWNILFNLNVQEKFRRKLMHQTQTLSGVFPIYGIDYATMVSIYGNAYFVNILTACYVNTY